MTRDDLVYYLQAELFPSQDECSDVFDRKGNLKRQYLLRRHPKLQLLTWILHVHRERGTPVYFPVYWEARAMASRIALSTPSMWGTGNMAALDEAERDYFDILHLSSCSPVPPVDSMSIFELKEAERLFGVGGATGYNS